MKLITPNKAAKQSGFSNHTVRKWINAGLVRSWRMPSGRVRIAAEDWERFVQSMAMERQEVEVLEVVEVVKTD